MILFAIILAMGVCTDLPTSPPDVRPPVTIIIRGPKNTRNAHGFSRFF